MFIKIKPKSIACKNLASSKKKPETCYAMHRDVVEALMHSWVPHACRFVLARGTWQDLEKEWATEYAFVNYFNLRDIRNLE